MLKVIFYALRCAPLFWFYVFKDLGKYIQRKGWYDFNYWGLHLFLGRFGGGKTISMVRRAYNICKTHHGVTVLTNLTLSGFPEDTKIIKLINSEQIKDLPDKSIVLIDEIGTIFNSRDFASSKKSVPKPVYQVILQCRHRRIMLLGSVQRWNLLDKQLRDIADSVTECHSYLMDPFSRYTTCLEYDAQQYDIGEDKPLLNLDVIEGVLKSHCFVSHFRRSNPKRESGELVPIFKVPALSTYDDILPVDIVESMNLSTCHFGKTIYLGKNHSSRSVRIYDKLAEQKVKGAKLPEDLKHWVRFEIELHDNNAGAAFSKFLDCKNPTEFSQYVSRVSYNLIRFIDKDHSRRYNCTVCDWWLRFLGSLADKGMYINKLSTNQYLRSKKYFNQCLSASLAQLFLLDSRQFVQGLKDGISKPSKTADRIKADYIAYQSLSPGDKAAAVEEVYRTVSGEDYWRMFADQTEGDFDERMLKLFEQVAQ